MLNAPLPLVVEAVDSPDGPLPRWVVWRGKRRLVAAVDDVWHVDDEWWRAEVRRRYCIVTFADGGRLTLYCDLLEGSWWDQHY